MIGVSIIVAATLLLAIAEMRHQSISSAILPVQRAPVARYSAPPSQVAIGSSIVESVAGPGLGVAEKAVQDALQNAGNSLASAVPIVGAVISAVGGILIAQHTARLKGATNENQAADQTIPAFDADLAEIANAYNSGTLNGKPFTPVMAIAALQKVDVQIKTYLKSKVGAPGTAWKDGGICDKSCTVGCCLYWNDLRPAIFGAPVFANGTMGFIPVIKRGGGTVYVPKIYPPSNKAYGDYSRESYTMELRAPSQPSSIFGL